ncbi:MAG: class I SAM-dependent methyltransferase, partial [Bacteroidales bacterium]|nr:class I SAM-dependent methyltransferase [Bacteroidales bacterium]
MNVTLENYRTLNFDTIDIKEEWNMPAEREHRMHSIHAYPAKFPAFITTKAIQKAEEKKISVDIVADIFCGCGTVAFETVKNGKSFWGCDINPVATLIAKTKSLSYNDGLLGDYYDNIISCYNESSINEDDEIYKNER